MPQRIIAIGDIHGCLAALHAVLNEIQPSIDDAVVTLGDYVDRGPDSRGVMETLLALEKQTNLAALLGNHDETMLNVCRGRLDLLSDWLLYGGDTTLASYGTRHPRDIWPAHLAFIARCGLVYETPQHFFVHANYRADRALNKLSREVLLWESLKRHVPGPHYSGKKAILGHTSQRSGEVLDLGHLRCIDTWCYGDGWLTAMDVQTGQVWQANKKGELRR